MNTDAQDHAPHEDAWECPSCHQDVNPEEDYICGTCDMPASHHARATTLCHRLRNSEIHISLLTEERNDLRKKLAQVHRDYGCELRDPNGTIWEYAKKLQDENKRLKELIENPKIYLN